MSDISDFAKLWIAVFLTGLLIGAIILGWDLVLGPAFNQASYNNFNTSPQHVQAVAQKFADDCQQLAQAHDSVARKAIEQDIYEMAATVDVKQIAMPDGVRACVNRAIADISSGGK